jgi:undecaprenyl-diphosphatase|tara:strand:- start:1095 stop:1904 length:810 start_codon:yes stop_codon:yes gene_type:complete
LDLSFFQIIFLAALQGLTEFLPISSSGHLILPSELFGWQDQGLVFDVAVHVGSLLAVVLYFRTQLFTLLLAFTRSFGKEEQTDDAKLAWLIILATLPAGFAGLWLNDVVEQYSRSMLVIAVSSIVFSLFLYFSDRPARAVKGLHELTWKTGLLIGIAQMLALIPGTSRSGVTMTAALYCNLTRPAAARFSFLLAIPIIAASGLLKSIELYAVDTSGSEWLILFYATGLAAVVAYNCIHFFLQLIERVGFLPFVIYRLVLGGLLLVIYFV